MFPSLLAHALPHPSCRIDVFPALNYERCVTIVMKVRDYLLFLYPSHSLNEDLADLLTRTRKYAHAHTRTYIQKVGILESNGLK